MVESKLPHGWIYVIIPAFQKNMPVFCAFCKQCRQYFTEGIEVKLNGDAHFSKSALPRFGCVPIDEATAALAELQDNELPN